LNPGGFALLLFGGLLLKVRIVPTKGVFLLVAFLSLEHLGLLVGLQLLASGNPLLHKLLLLLVINLVFLPSLLSDLFVSYRIGLHEVKQSLNSGGLGFLPGVVRLGRHCF
jgi:hypothetical protein